MKLCYLEGVYKREIIFTSDIYVINFSKSFRALSPSPQEKENAGAFGTINDTVLRYNIVLYSILLSYVPSILIN